MAAKTKRRLDYTADIEFVRHERSGTVHVVRFPEIDAEVKSALFADGAAAEIFVNAAYERTVFMCGWSVWVNRVENRGAFPVDRFPDNDLCSKCVKAMGPESWRAFEHPQPGDGDAGGDE